MTQHVLKIAKISLFCVLFSIQLLILARYNFHKLKFKLSIIFVGDTYQIVNTKIGAKKRASHKRLDRNAYSKTTRS